MDAIIYCRVSSKEQLEGTSLESQESACRDFARSKHIGVAAVFVEQGESAKFADRTQLLALIDFCRKNKGTVDTLIVWKIDRFARNIADHYSIKSTLLKYGVKITSVTEPIDSDPTGKLMEGVLASVAQFDNDVRAMRTVQGMRRRIHDGIFPWGPPYGYKRSVARGEKKNLPDLPDQPTFAVLQRAWKLFATGAYTQAEMGRLMVSWGLTSARGDTSFCPQALYQLFTNPYYKGVLVDPWDSQEHDGKHEPMVTKEEFALVQEVISRRNRSVPHQKDRPEFPLRGFARCQSCLHPVTGAISRGRSQSYPYYVCQVKTCDDRSMSHPVGPIHEEFGSFLDSVAPHRDIFPQIADMVTREIKQRETQQEARKAVRKLRAQKFDKELQELIRMRAQSLLTDDEFIRQRKILVDQRAAVGGKTVIPTADAEEVREHFEKIAEPLVTLRSTWTRIQPPYRRRFERLILPAGFVIGETRTADLGPLFRFFRRFMASDSSVVPSPCVLSNQIIPDIQGLWRALNGIEEIEDEVFGPVR